VFQKTRKKFQELSREQQSMVFVFWIYKFVAIISGLFLAVFVYLQTQSISSFALYLATSHTALMIGFVGFGWLMGRLRISIRYNYVRAFGLFFLASLILVFLPHTFGWLLAYAIVQGIGNGVMWLTIHTMELVHTKDVGRDFYSSMVELGSQVMVVASPFIATASFIISETVLHTETYFLLFLLLPLASLAALPLLFRIPDYVPERVTLEKIRRLLAKRNVPALRYYVAGSFHYALQGVVVPVIAIVSLGTVINLGLTETVLGIVSVVAVLVLSHVRHPENRLRLMLQTIMLFLAAYAILFFFDASPIVYVVYALIVVVLKPILRVSEHVIDLYSVDMLKADGMSFYPGLLLRDFVLWIGRIVVPAAVAWLTVLIANDALLLKASIVLLGFLLLGSWAAARSLILATSHRHILPRKPDPSEMPV
jgi:MFS family permease